MSQQESDIKEDTSVTEPQDGPLCIGDKVEVQLKKKTSIGELKFVGRIKGKPRIVYGVELRRQEGKNSGGLQGQDYFPCAQQCGVFVGRNKILRYKPAEGQEDFPRLTYGDAVEVANLGTGTIRYMGYPQFCEGMRYGIELDKPNGRFNGTVEGVYYFNARNLFGAFVELGELQKLEEEDDAEDEELAATEEKEMEAQNEEDNGDGAEPAADEEQEPVADETDAADAGGNEMPVEEKRAVVDTPAVVIDTSGRFIPALRNDSLLSFMIRQPNGDLRAALFDMYCGEGGSLLKSSFEDMRNCTPSDQLNIACLLLQRFLSSDVPDFTSILSCAPYGCGENGIYETDESFRSGVEGAYQDLLAVKNEDALQTTIPLSYLQSLPVSPVPASIQNNLIGLDDFLDSAQTGDFVLFGGDSGLNRLLAHFTNSPFTQAAIVVKGPISSEENTYSSEDSVALIHACTSPCSQLMDGVLDDSLAHSVVAGEAVSLLQDKKFAGEFAVFYKLESDDSEMLDEIRQKVGEFASSNVGASFEGGQDGFPAKVGQVLTAMYAARDEQANRFPSTALLASALQEGGAISASRKPQSFVGGSFCSCCASRAGYQNGPYPHISKSLYDGIAVSQGALVDFNTLPA